MNIYVGNLSANTTAWQVRKAFEMYGKVDTITLHPKPVSSEAFSFCFVEMPFENQAALAIDKLNGSSLGGKVISAKASGVNT